MDWASLSHLAQALFIGVCAIAFCIGIFTGQQR